MYALYNSILNKFLKHPQFGLWHTSDLKEAVSMLEDCKDHLRNHNIEFEENDYVIYDLEKKEILYLKDIDN